jgi:hypothetical protein
MSYSPYPSLPLSSMCPLPIEDHQEPKLYQDRGVSGIRDLFAHRCTDIRMKVFLGLAVYMTSIHSNLGTR